MVSISDTNQRLIQYCGFCGGELQNAVILGHQRKQCRECGKVNYINPIPAVAMIATKAPDNILLVRRNAPPEIGCWCLPGGS